VNTLDIEQCFLVGQSTNFKMRKFWILLGTVFLARVVALLDGEDLDTTPTVVPATPASGNDWYRPPPLDPHPKLPFLPITAGRPSMPVPRLNRDKAISKLTNAEMVKLTDEDCRTLGVPFAADKLIETEIEQTEEDVKLGGWHLKRFPLNGSEFDSTYYAILNSIAEDKKRITQLKILKGQVRPYLVRAVAANDFHEEFDASFWEGSVTVTHRFEIHHSANDPLRSHASIGNLKPADTVKWPVVVYLETPPSHVYTTIHVLKLGK
jgi:hypothetical protein